MVDRERVVQLLANLLGACIRFAQKGGTVTVAIGAGDERGEVCVDVGDDGPGITADEVEHAFDRRWWAQRGAGLSTGLALTVAKGIVEAHGGRIELTSAPGAGTVFHVTLPAARARFTGAIASGVTA
jgi:signal transduction histidine kinase